MAPRIGAASALRLAAAVPLALFSLAAAESPPEMPLALTCSPGSPAAALPFCDTTKPFAARAALLAAELTLAEQLNIWAFSQTTDPIPRLNLKGSSSKGQTCIHGLAPGAVFPGGSGAVASPALTVTGHAINLGSTFDVELVELVSNLTWVELRGSTQLQYHASNGSYVANCICSGGPLANSAHDPRCACSCPSGPSRHHTSTEHTHFNLPPSVCICPRLRTPARLTSFPSCVAPFNSKGGGGSLRRTARTLT